MIRFARALVLAVVVAVPSLAHAAEVSKQAVWFRVVNPLSPLFAVDATRLRRSAAAPSIRDAAAPGATTRYDLCASSS